MAFFLVEASSVFGQAEKHTVHSADGTTIGYAKIGSGSIPLVIVHGAINSSEDWKQVATVMGSDFTCYVMDRWGRGGSSYREDYSIAKEAEDIMAVLKEAGQDAFLLAHSSGSIYALEATLRTPPAGLILYEPPLHLERFSNEVMGLISKAAKDERYDEVVSIFLSKEAGLPEEVLAQIQSSPAWGHMVDLAPQSVREWEALVQAGLPIERYKDISVPTLLLTGSITEHHPTFATKALVGTLQDARIEILEGQDHGANHAAPEMVATEVTNFILETNR